jgi:hypothetical protein
MEKVSLEMKRVIKPDGKCILVLGDWHRGNRIVNTALEVRKILGKIGFRAHAIVDDFIPYSKSVQRTPRGKKHGRDRYDRILVCTNRA